MTDLAYASARIAARFGARPQDRDWRQLEMQRTLAALLDAARGTALGHFTAGVTASLDAHGIAAVLRGHRRALAAEFNAWMPAPWRPALAWLGVAPDLQVCAHLAAGRPAREWMRDDAVYRAWLAADAAVVPAGAVDAPPRGRKAGDGALAALAAPDRATPATDARWRDEWRRRLPRGAPPPLVGAGYRIAAHFCAPAAAALAPPSAARFDARAAEAPADSAAYRRADHGKPPGALATGPERAALSARLTRLYRRGGGEPSAAFACLGLALLDLERLEGELARRVLFPDLPLAA
jgi:hypothetical protein